VTGLSGAGVGLVTGGATGIGKAICLQLAHSGLGNLVTNFHMQKEAAAQTVAELQDLGCNAIAVAADISDQSQVDQMIDVAARKFGRLDILVNNAGTTKAIPLDDLDAVTDEIWDTIMDVNLRGPFYCSRSAAPLLRATCGVIVNVASVSAIRPSGSSLPYIVAKAGLVQLTRTLALALAPEVRVNAVLPGFVPTDWHSRLHGRVTAARLAEEVKSRTPLGRLTTPEDVAFAVASVMGGFSTGQCLVVDGGRELLY